MTSVTEGREIDESLMSVTVGREIDESDVSHCGEGD